MNTTTVACAHDWITILQALLTPTIAVAATVVGIAQWWTARNKYRLDLFDRRWAVYMATKEIVGAIFSHARSSREDEFKFLQRIRGARWLFDQRLDTYLKELWRKVCELGAANSMLEEGAPAGGRPGAAAKKAEIRLRWGAPRLWTPHGHEFPSHPSSFGNGP